MYLRDQHTGAPDGLDALLCGLGEELGFDDDGLLGQVALAQHLVVTGADDVDDRGLVGDLLVLLPRLVGHERPEAVHVDGRAEELVLRLVEVPHAHLAKVTGVVFVEVYAVVVHAAGVTAPARVLPVLADTAVAVADMATEFPGLLSFVESHGG